MGQTLFVILLETTPILLAALGGAFTQQANILNIALEGMMLIGAFAAIAIGAATQSLVLAVAGAVLAGLLLSLLFAWVSLGLRADEIVAGIGINLLADGITVFLLEHLYQNEGSFSPQHLPQLWKLELGPLARIPLLGPMLEGQTVIVVAALLLVPLSWLVLYRTRFGVHLRAVGESEEAAVAAGIDPRRVKLAAVLVSGALCGLAGAQLAMGTLGIFSRGMTSGRGFIALAALVFGGATPGGTFVASLLFGAADGVADRLQVVQVVPSQIVLMLPYLVTILALTAAAVRRRRLTRRGVDRTTPNSGELGTPRGRLSTGGP
jgi:general nucleoside transport system permease protein